MVNFTACDLLFNLSTLDKNILQFLLIDDHEIVRTGINLLLSKIYHPVVIHEAADGESATDLLKKNYYDLVLMDVQMPNTDTFGLLEYITIKFPKIKVLIFSMSAERIFAKRFLKAGVKGFVSKDASLNEVKSAIGLVLDNRRYISEQLQSQLADELASAESKSPFDELNPKEFEIVTLFLAGEQIASISKILNLKSSTVGLYKNKIFEKLGVKNFLELQALYD